MPSSCDGFLHCLPVYYGRAGAALVLNLTHSGHLPNTCQRREQWIKRLEAGRPVQGHSRALLGLDSRSVGTWAGVEICREVKLRHHVSHLPEATFLKRQPRAGSSLEPLPCSWLVMGASQCLSSHPLWALGSVL